MDVTRFGVEPLCLLFKQLLVKKVDTFQNPYVDSHAFLMLAVIVARAEPYASRILKEPVFDARALQEYILICCQRPTGGLVDKPDT